MTFEEMYAALLEHPVNVNPVLPYQYLKKGRSKGKERAVDWWRRFCCVRYFVGLVVEWVYKFIIQFLISTFVQGQYNSTNCKFFYPLFAGFPYLFLQSLSAPESFII